MVNLQLRLCGDPAIFTIKFNKLGHIFFLNTHNLLARCNDLRRQTDITPGYVSINSFYEDNFFFYIVLVLTVTQSGKGTTKVTLSLFIEEEKKYLHKVFEFPLCPQDIFEIQQSSLGKGSIYSYILPKIFFYADFFSLLFSFSYNCQKLLKANKYKQVCQQI